jgi:drug/metabolite transporter (DMT)-like permease
MLPDRPTRVRAVIALIVACQLWGASFPITKALSLGARVGDSPPSIWFVSAYLVGARFFVAALLVGIVSRKVPRRPELFQGIWLGFATGAGMVFQTDALAHTDASIVAFLTQGYVVLLPMIGIVTTRTWPSGRIAVCAAVVSVGLAVLSRFDPASMTLGRGEAETLAATACFTVQILFLDAVRFEGNRPTPVTVVMFATIAVVMALVATPSARGAGDFMVLFAGPVSVAYFAFLVVFPTIGSFLLMNRFQRALHPSEAGIIYATEPVFASALALFLPALLSRTLHVEYADETLGARLLLGGALVVGATVLMALLIPSVPVVDGLPAART